MRKSVFARTALAFTISASSALTITTAAGAQDSARVSTPARAGMPIRPAKEKERRAVVDRLQDRVDAILRQRLQLTDDQFAKLQAVNNRLEAERREVRSEEMEIRRALREETLPGATSNDAKIAELLDRLPAAERKRINLQEKEQKELAAFMQPIQRARFFGLRDEIMRSLQEAQRGRLGGGPGRGGPPGLRAPKRDGRGFPPGPPDAALR